MKKRPRYLRQRESRLPLLLSFCLPFGVAVVAFIVAGLYPFGNSTILAHDGWHQYFPFFVEFREKLVSGGSLEYTWSVGMGTSYLSLFAYYLASPLNLLCVLVPTEYLTELYAFLTVLKLGLAGLSFGVFVRTVYRRNDLYIPCFALMYALCVWAGGYYWNLIWLDTFALLPLLIAGTIALTRDGRFRLYICALALSLWCNYYIAYFCCIFVALCFFGYCICRPNGFRGFLRRFARIGICTLIGVAMAGVLLLPTLKAMQTTYSADSTVPNLLAMNIADGVKGDVGEGTLWELLKTETFPGLLSAVSQVLGNLLTGVTPTKMSGLPNISTGVTAIFLSVYFLGSKRVSRREKAFSVGLLAFFVLSFILRILDYVWHGFHFPNMLPYRFSFLFSFVVIAMAYRAFTLLDSCRGRHLFAAAMVTLLLLANALYQEASTLVLIASAAALVLALVIFLLYVRNKLPRHLGKALICLLLVAETTLNFAMGVAEVSVTTRSTYPKEGESVEAVLERREEEPLLYRTETTTTQTLNDAALNDYDGVSIFTSSANVNFNRFSRSLGLASWPGSNRYVYYESSPFTNLMCGIKYLIDRDGGYYNKDYNALAAADGEVNLLENEAFISIGFMADSALGDFVAESGRYNPIWEQEDMFLAATGIEEPLYEHLAHSALEADENCTIRASGTSGTQYSYSTEDATETSEFRISYTLEKSGLYCATSKRPVTDANKLKVYCNGELLYTLEIKARALFCLGNFNAGDTLEFVYSIPKNKNGAISLDVALQNNEVFDAGYAALADEPWELTEVSDTRISGTITALEDGLFYTSIPYEPGWTAYVDGQEVELGATYDPTSEDVALTDAVIAFPLRAGTHSITLRYRTPGLTEGLLLTIGGLLCFALLLLLCRKRHSLFPEPAKPFVAPTVDFLPPPEPEEPEEPETEAPTPDQPAE
ncbi:MAG: YfhO family protein [Oscillospiraceae bacterium]|nr:YfhO family protein [Oscillospiraceae bacterium]